MWSGNNARIPRKTSATEPSRGRGGTRIGDNVNAALAADGEVGEPFVRRSRDAKLPEGRCRYYSGLLTMMGLLEVGGKFRIFGPPASVR